MPRARPHTPRTHPLTTPARTSVFDLHRAFQDLVYQAGSLANVGSASLENGVCPPHRDSPVALHRDHSPRPGLSTPVCRGPRPAQSALLTCWGPAAPGLASSGPTSLLCDLGPAASPL